ncbi:37S ribosomal protein-like protein Rsm22 [Geopyxis carbonaria]|nr:37S ribosomal protein-like protein Rsm22 [Geopyxis carbonaria]
MILRCLNRARALPLALSFACLPPRPNLRLHLRALATTTPLHNSPPPPPPPSESASLSTPTTTSTEPPLPKLTPEEHEQLLEKYATRDPAQDIGVYVTRVRELWGNALPHELLSKKEYAVYERRYGAPTRWVAWGEAEAERIVEGAGGEPVEVPAVTVVDKNGEVVEMESEEGMEEEWEEEEGMESDEEGREERDEEEREDGLRRSAAGGHLYEPRVAYEPDLQLALNMTRGTLAPEAEEAEESGGDDEAPYLRTHPLTKLGQFGTHPYTATFPSDLQTTTETLLADLDTKNRHLDAAARTILGPVFQNSPLMAPRGGKRVAPIKLHPSGPMSQMEANVFLATLLPGYYAQSLGALTELRRRLGGEWVLGGGEGGDEPGVVNVLDVGTGGAGALAWRNIVEAEQALRADHDRAVSGTEPEPPETTEEDLEAPNGVKATVVVGSDTLRYRMSKHLPSTTFIPRLPDTATENPHEDTQPRKLYDLIIATNSIRPLRPAPATHRKTHIHNLWQLLSPRGVLVLIEKGDQYGFESIAAARELLTSPPPAPGADGTETAAIIAPCTNHLPCPLFRSGPHATARKELCTFRQRYTRPSYTQRLAAPHSARNHADLSYSFVAARRGTAPAVALDPAPGLGDFDLTTTPPSSAFPLSALRQHALTLPRLILPPLKRRGHVVLDVCTPRGQIERWTVPRSRGKTAYRDARKAQWGDLWALGAKTMVGRNLDTGKGRREGGKKRVVRTFDLGAGEVRERWTTGDVKGGKKRNPGKRERERREEGRRGRREWVQAGGKWELRGSGE